MNIKEYIGSSEWSETIPGLPWSAKELFNGSIQGYEVVRILLRVCNIWDDLVDGDKKVSKSEVNYAFIAIAHDLERNPFYAHWRSELMPMFTNAILSWMTANVYEDGKDLEGIEIAYGLRYGVVQMCAYVVYLCQGARIENAIEYVPALTKALYQERFDDYREEIYARV